MAGMNQIGGYSSMATSAIGTLMTAYQQREAASNAEDIANINAKNALRVAQYNAAKHEIAAGQEKAAAQKAAKETRRQFRLKQSRALALAAASGGGTMDMDVVNAIAGFEVESDIAAKTDLYHGEERARLLKERGSEAIWEAKTEGDMLKAKGKIKAAGYRSQALSTLMGGASSLARKYGEFKDGGY